MYNLDNIPVNNKDDCIVACFIIEHSLTTKLPCSNEDIETMIFYNVIEVDYSTNGLRICNRTKSLVLKEFAERIEEYRKLFHKSNINFEGKSVSSKNILDKISRFFKQYPQYDADSVIKAAQQHVSENITKPQYIMKADNFIFKRDAGIWKSRLLDYLEQMDEQLEQQQNLFL